MAHPVPAILRSTHPLPTIAVTSIVVILGIGSGLEPWRIAVLALTLLANQASVGLSNDWLDAARDRAIGRTDKPVATGEVRESTAAATAVTLAIVSILLSLILGWPAALAHLVFLASGWAYNVWLKRTVLSVLPYATGFGALPFIVTLSAAEPQFPAVGVVVAGALFGVAAHFANVLPDLDDDRATGVRGLPHRLGLKASKRSAAIFRGVMVIAVVTAVVIAFSGSLA